MHKGMEKQMAPLEWIFWTCFAIVAYTYLIYPAILLTLNGLFGRKRIFGRVQTSVSFLVPVHNEEHNLERRLEELTRLIHEAGTQGEVIVISDGSTDQSVVIARFAERGVRVIEMPTKSGKAAALNAGAAAGRRTAYPCRCPTTLGGRRTDRLWKILPTRKLARQRRSRARKRAGVLAGVGIYWRYEKWLRKQESRLGSQVGVTGAISALRRTLFHPIPAGTLLDDVFWPMHVVLQGYRVVHDERARAFDRLPEKTHDEFRRKVRTLAGNYQLLTLLPFAALFPWSNRVWLQWISHKLMRLVVPWALLGMLGSSFLIKQDFYQLFFWIQTANYGMAALGIAPSDRTRDQATGHGCVVSVVEHRRLAGVLGVDQRPGRGVVAQGAI